MKFCNKCDNMYYISISGDDENVLTYSCRSCGDVDTSVSNEGMCVLDTHFNGSSMKNVKTVNEFTKLDPTLPRIANMQCPNVKCKSNKDGEKSGPDVIYMRYDNSNLKYIYICQSCDSSWNS
jgi:DNA-directed RNA polymerase subunit M/transcription elongation factor TFIIS